MTAGGLISLLAFILACAAAAAPGLVLRPGRWYEDLVKPSWRPPNWLFGPVWLVLYLMIAVSGWQVWRKAGFDGAAGALAVYAVQLVFNGLWSAIFFGLHRPGLALIEIVCLWLSILATVVAFHPVDEWAAYMLVPYALWVAFAVVLNFRIWRLNPGRASSSGR
jgi:benzodiazapine receptor